jgi:hypothetical protein
VVVGGERIGKTARFGVDLTDDQDSMRGRGRWHFSRLIRLIRLIEFTKILRIKAKGERLKVFVNQLEFVASKNVNRFPFTFNLVSLCPNGFPF